MKIAILTMFNGLSETYSLVNVVADQLRMLLPHHEVKLLVSEHCSESERFGIFLDPRIEWVSITNTHNGSPIFWHDYAQGTGTVHPTFFAEAKTIANDFLAHLQDVDICIMHDILYQGWHLVHNIAMRKAIRKLPNLRCLAFTHSFPAEPPKKISAPFGARFSPMKQTTFVYPSPTGLPALANQYRTTLDNCKSIANALPILETLNADVSAIHKHIDLLSPDILIVYPCRLTTSKRLEKVASLAGAIKTATKLSVSVIFCDFPSIDVNSIFYKLLIKMEGEKYGLPMSSILFTSDAGYPDGFPRAAVLDLFTLSNLFICPSFSESFGLTVLEAASRGNFLVLNQAVPALEDLGNKLGAYFLRWDANNFGFQTTETYHPSEEAYYLEHGAEIVALMQSDFAVRAKTRVRTQFHPQAIYEEQLSPLLEAEVRVSRE